jgi:hypothetical protein
MVTIFATVLVCATAVAKSDVDSKVGGKWDLNVNTGDGNQENASLELKIAADGAVTGTVSSRYGNAEITKGSVDGDSFSISFKLTIDDSLTDITMRGAVNGDSVKGDGTAGDGTFTFTGTRAK